MRGASLLLLGPARSRIFEPLLLLQVAARVDR